MKHLTRVIGKAWGNCSRRYISVRGDRGLCWPAGVGNSQVSTQHKDIEGQVEKERANGPNGQYLQANTCLSPSIMT